jgi:MoaA/NifB/PqqE/SkfB family radical SAM enzyme
MAVTDDKNAALRRLRTRTYKNLLYGLLHPAQPSYLILYVNNVCQLRCNMCFYWDAMQVRTVQLSLSEVEAIAKSMPNLLQLTLTGGEPSLRKDLPKIPELFATHSHLAKCTIVTNGLLSERIRDQVAEMVATSPEVDFRISVSVDDIGERHDQIRGLKGSFDALVRTLELLFELRATVHNLWIDVNTTISKYNCENFESISAYVKTHFRVDNHVFAYTRGVPKEKDAKDVPAEHYQRIKQLIRDNEATSAHFFQGPTKVVRDMVRDEVEREILTNAHHYDCTAGKKFIEIYQDGRVAPCEILETLIDPEASIMGRLQDFDFDMQKLLASERAQKVINYIKASKCHCTFECPKHMDVIYTAAFYPKLLKGLIAEAL